jgi:hypothetical protein
MRRVANWIRETIKWRTARRRLKISVGVSGPSATKLADAICEIADNLNRVVTEEEIEAVSAVLKGKLAPITYPEPHTVRLKPCMISWEAAEAARNRPSKQESGAVVPTKVRVGPTSQPRKPQGTFTVTNGIRIKLK